MLPHVELKFPEALRLTLSLRHFLSLSQRRLLVLRANLLLEGSLLL
jgi:hypothetical protein